MIAVVEDTCVKIKKWITDDEMLNLTVIAESTPGPIAINCATYVGYKQKGVLGAAVATFGMVLPSFIIIYLISMFLDTFLEIKIIADAFKGIKLAVGILVVDAGIRMFKKLKKTPLGMTVFGVSVAAVLCVNFFALSFSTIALILIAAAVGLCANAIAKRGGKK